ncbi:hypothetical protein F8S09_13330 [Deinococcus sp. SDU3-2]|uniref:Uncharacterized protein n=1 Tax=Deinococcus terrestris TaxID=2651870 RepID=A0A7X1NY51_9DEIO|nr:hypothetical protein [Deinococcus terrestris]MPY67654.1 hypothetical protein [Deinococcus terrestris]
MRLRRVIRRGSRSRRCKKPLTLDTGLDLAAQYFIRSFLHLTEWWLAPPDAQAHGPERMGEIYAELILRPTLAAALRASVTRPPADTGSG